LRYSSRSRSKYPNRKQEREKNLKMQSCVPNILLLGIPEGVKEYAGVKFPKE
jgi:hypothetical protein